ncbi:MAG: hypothetical protein JWP57_4419, partial [Spirosoma sp.]|nr:hypothetical protein [Spirosoma sp.]
TKVEREQIKVEAKAAGAAAYAAGAPCVAPSYGWGDIEACWRLGWKRAAAIAVAKDWSEGVRV